MRSDLERIPPLLPSCMLHRTELPGSPESVVIRILRPTRSHKAFHPNRARVRSTLPLRNPRSDRPPLSGLVSPLNLNYSRSFASIRGCHVSHSRLWPGVIAATWWIRATTGRLGSGLARRDYWTTTLRSCPRSYALRGSGRRPGLRALRLVETIPDGRLIRAGPPAFVFHIGLQVQPN